MSGRAPIVQERVLHAPPADVFAAWSDPESLGVWMCPGEDISRATVRVDFRVGGRFAIVMHGAQRDYGQTGEYLEIDPPKRLVFTWVSDFVPPEDAHTRVTVELEPEGSAHTRIVLTHHALPDSDSYDGHVAGWARILERLGAALGRTRQGDSA